jgi:pimeloyl-ACP methyl ester carboxylesterase
MPTQIGFRKEHRLLDDKERREAMGKFVRLSNGMTHYELAGSENGEVVVLIHGFSVPFYIWDANFSVLAEAGFRVLRYDLFGRGYSDRPRARYDQVFFDLQLTELLDSLKIIRPVNLVGVSMGGLIAVVFTDRHPQRASRLALIDPFCHPVKSDLGFKILTLPLIGDIVMDWFADRMLLDQSSDFYHPERFPDYNAMFLPQTQYIGFKRAMLATTRHMMRSDVTSPYRRIGKSPRPAMLIWGRHDKVVPFEQNTLVKEMIPYIQFEPIDDAGHVPNYEHPEVVNPLLINFLRSK